MESTTTPGSTTAAGFRVRRVVADPPAEPHAGGQPVAAAWRDAPTSGLVDVLDVDGVTRQELVRLVGVLLEVLDGRRPLAQLATRGLVAPEVARYLRADRRGGRGRRVSRVESVHVCAPRAGVAEIAAVCRIEGAVRAVALRAERDEQPYDDRPWRVVALRIIRGAGTGRTR